jgi:hypothetical protein
VANGGSPTGGLNCSALPCAHDELNLNWLSGNQMVLGWRAPAQPNKMLGPLVVVSCQAGHFQIKSVDPADGPNCESDMFSSVCSLPTSSVVCSHCQRQSMQIRACNLRECAESAPRQAACEGCVYMPRTTTTRESVRTSETSSM